MITIRMTNIRMTMRIMTTAATRTMRIMTRITTTGDDHYDDSDEDYDEYDDGDSWYDLEVSGAGWDDQEGGVAYWDEMDDARRYQLKLYIDDKLYESDLLSEEASYDFSEYFYRRRKLLL